MSSSGFFRGASDADSTLCTKNKSRRKENSNHEDENSGRFELLFGISKILVKLGARQLLTFQVVVSGLLLIQWVPNMEASPSPAPAPAPVMTSNEGAYSLFPNEDLRTGRSRLRPEEELRPLRERNQILLDPYRDRDRNQFSLDQYSDRDGRNNRFRDDTQVSLRRISNYRVTRPIEKYNQVLFDDERLNYPSVRFEDRENRDRTYDRSRYRDSGYFNSYRDRDLPYDRHRLRTIYLPPTSPRHLSGFRPGLAIHEPNPRPYLPSPEDSSKARIHVFDPASKTFKQGLPTPNVPKDNVKPGRLFIPGVKTGSSEEPGPNVFLNHDEYLDFHTKKALAALDAQEKNTGGKAESESDKQNRAKHLLFSPNIGGLRPPVPNSSSGESSEDSSGAEVDNNGKPEIKTQKVKGVIVKAMAEASSNDQTKNEGDKNGQQSQQLGQPNPPLRLRGVPSSSPRSSSSLALSPVQDVAQTKGIKSQLGTEVAQQQNTIAGVDNLKTFFNGQLLNQIPPVTQSSLTLNDNSFFSVVNHNEFAPSTVPVTEINFTPSTIPYFDENHGPFVGPTFGPGSEQPPLIFLESQGKDEEFLGKANDNRILVQRVRNKPKNSNGTNKVTTSDSKSNVKNSGQGKDVETTMKVHKSQADSFDGSKDFNLDSESMSSRGVVSKVHAHISNCPKLHGAAEVICDVHIRKRHGSPNPQLIVGWKRKFHNATQPDIVLALNKTLAYEEDFHDKFNVTLAPGISPMLRSVLLIRHVAPPDTGNYQCEVSDGENRLKSDTLLFLCH